MKNLIDIDGHKAVVSFDPEISMFRGEFLGLNGGADFYADTVAGLMEEGRVSLQLFLDECEKQGIEPFRRFSGKFNLRLDPPLHEAATLAAAAARKSLNEWVAEKIERAVKEEA
ncbi:type II toxin-antitoxin system HicB family antitoxin [Geminicoccus roseus]|uniref:type II toxin-antitoxin system HicB family antitoxin n=1 Tax=Geminicoccus roseus TaxID=404900 RepID=UPI0004176D1D|nr:type II toxin-antitoxin system HicB family antitoxin [Geminicoccus roseus]